MTSWNLRDEISTITYYLRFKRHKWCSVDSVPEWVKNRKPTYTEGKEISSGDTIHYEREFWVGDNLKYRIDWRKVAHGKYDIDGMYVRLR